MKRLKKRSGYSTLLCTTETLRNARQDQFHSQQASASDPFRCSMSLRTSKEDEQVAGSKLSWSVYEHMELQKLGTALTEQRKNDDSHIATGMNSDVASISSWSKSYI